ncbi:seizure 6-like protein [Pseudoliparis swirei]|uniref:seizure 6-like protein n=1 Tax=Pseudoliparis swirei TaxID=2059687 RepID=UPI0024BED124|nr:seizure 6-like protein [Pseudoliparis swirei]
MPRAGRALRVALSAALWIGLLWSRAQARDEEDPSSPTWPPAGGPRARPPSSLPSALLQSVLTHKGLLVPQRGGLLPSALPQNLLPLLGRGLGRGPLPGGGPGEPLPTHTHTQLADTHTAEQEEEQEEEEEEEQEEEQEEVTTTMMDTQTENPSSAAPGCTVNFSDPEGYIDSADDPTPDGAAVTCTYTVTVYTGYGVELQVKSVNLSEGEQLSIRSADASGALLVLANHTLLVEGQVIRSPSNTLSVRYRSAPEAGGGGVGGAVLVARPCSTCYAQHCMPIAVCNSLAINLFLILILILKNATVGRVLSPSPPHGPNATQERSCSWSLEAPKGQRLHLHLERLSLGATDRLVLWSGLDADSVVLFDSGRGGQIPFEGVISEGPAVRVQFTRDQPDQNTGFNIRYEAFKRGRCYEPYLQNGNFSTTDPLYAVGAVVRFWCEPGHALEQGQPAIQCVSARDPYWNDTEPLCKAQCGGDLSGPSGVILSPNWPDAYGEGEDCSWRVRVEQDKRVLLDIQLLNISASDMLTVTDGDEVATRVLGGAGPFRLSSTTPDLTVTFHSDPTGLVFGKGGGFILSYMEVSRNDSCPDLPEIQNGWKTTSHVALVRGARITFQCDPGYDLVGGATLGCRPELSWSGPPPFCEKIMYCSDPGHVDHSTRALSDPKLLVGTTIQYSCNPGFVLQGGATISCYGREPGTPVWTSRLPHCVSEDSVSCENPGLPANGYQILSKRLYLPAETLTLVCYQGYELIGEMAIKCILGNPSFWSGPLPLCRANKECFISRALEVAEAPVGSGLDGGNIALAIFILVLLLSALVGGAYVYVTRCRFHSNLRLPLIYPHPYRQITVETEFDNPLYETGGLRLVFLSQKSVLHLHLHLNVSKTLENMKSRYETPS